ncbi:glycosyltransferase family 2 protein [Salinimicrobium catena]|uniref:glycosyltransferase family 2 protein n=1 Tax=Salinimicrobium catena TaxID=390640 RepID=UPI0015A4BAFA|nr:glycosyltransferase family 2 protein [Salinimicrobium catena]
MRLAIVIPYFKIGHFEKTLVSLARQTNKKFKVYIGNDASPEDPSCLIRKFKDQINIEYTRFEKNVGKSSLTAQWDRCIALTGEEDWLMVLGDDDFLSENYVQSFYDHLLEVEKRQIKVVRFASQIFFSETGKLSQIFTHPEIEKSTDFFHRKFIQKATRASLSEHIFKRSAYQKKGFRNFPLGWGADNFAWLDFSNFGNIYCINDAIAYVTMSNENISRQSFGQSFKLEAKVAYLELIIFKYLKSFDQSQRLDLLHYFERFIYDEGRIDFKFFTKMVWIYLKEKAFVQVIKFNRRVILNFLERRRRA